MCGIAGWYDKNKDLGSQEKTIKNMSNTMMRRGPDDDGIYLNNPVCLIHRRLAVIDVENGRQPMVKNHNNRTCAIAYNGELYNTSELRSELLSYGYTFSTQSDTEVVLASFMRWGSDCVYKLNGIFAFAIYDEDKKTLFIARDRIGVKPLFFFKYDTGLLFASEVKTLLANPKVKPEVDEQGLSEIFLIGPGRTLGQGIYRGVQELLPGECAVYDGNILNRHRYFTLTAHEHTSDTEQSITEETPLTSIIPAFGRS